MSDERFRARLRDAQAEPADLVAAKVAAVERVRRDLCPRCDQEVNHGYGTNSTPKCCGIDCFQSSDPAARPVSVFDNSCCPDCPWRKE